MKIYKLNYYFILVLSFLIHLEAVASGLGNDHPKSKKAYYTKAIENNAPSIDGIMNDPVWNQVEWATNFTQRDPSDGAPPTEQTSFKVLYDAKNIYIGIRAHDSQAHLIDKRLARRDGFAGDRVEINIDSYHDLQTAFSFTVSASGVLGDESISNDGVGWSSWDRNWNAIWWAKTSIDEKGWTAEIKIPLSQLRFTDAEELVWGLQIMRFLFREGERSYWEYIPKDSPGWVHLFGELKGLKGIKPQKQLEIAPYLLTGVEQNPIDPDNPYDTGVKSKFNGGVDGKIGITSDITLDFAINPDFGQVEADPSQLNLSAFEIYLRERRPFFIEGNNILNMPGTKSRAGGRYTRDNLIYTRRVGRRPSQYPDLDDNQFTDYPTATPILAALKLTGKNKNGFAFGIMENITPNTYTKVVTVDNSEDGDENRELVEPMTSYFAARLSQDFNEGNTVIGATVTSTNRALNGTDIDDLHKNAYTTGLDFIHNWDNRKYYFAGSMMFSHVDGSATAILETQESSRHFFQRPDANYVDIDSTLTSLQGTGGHIRAGKNTGRWQYELGGHWRSPSLELNDHGFLGNGDFKGQWAMVQYQTLRPVGILRSLRINFREFANFDYGNRATFFGLRSNVSFQFKNFWRFSYSFDPNIYRRSNFDLRGGPSIMYPSTIRNNIYISTDSRKKLVFEMGVNKAWGMENWENSTNFFTEISYRPIDKLQFNLRPFYNINHKELQYVTTVDDATDMVDYKYLMGTLDQKTFGATFRINYIITPNLSIQFYGQPFGSKGEYIDLKEITESNASNYQDRFHTYNNDQISYDEQEEEYLVDDNMDGTNDFTVSNPNFDFVEFRSNTVLRWEYQPGSTFFLVWSQNRSSREQKIDNFNPYSVLDNVFSVPAENIFMMKFTYRFRL